MVIALDIMWTLLVLRMAMPLRISMERLKFVSSPDLLIFIAAIFLSLARRVLVLFPPWTRLRLKWALKMLFALWAEALTCSPTSSESSCSSALLCE